MSTASVSISTTETTNNVVVPSLSEDSVTLAQTGGKSKGTKKTTKKSTKKTTTKKTAIKKTATKKTAKKTTAKKTTTKKTATKKKKAATTADGKPKIKTVGSRREVWEGKAKRTSGHLTKDDLLLNSAGKPVSRAQHEKGLKQYAVLKPWRDHLNAFRKAHPEMSLKEQMKAASKTYKKKGTKKTAAAKKTTKKKTVAAKKTSKSSKKKK